MLPSYRELGNPIFERRGLSGLCYLTTDFQDTKSASSCFLSIPEILCFVVRKENIISVLRENTDQ